jgi:hypothetical protein
MGVEAFTASSLLEVFMEVMRKEGLEEVRRGGREVLAVSALTIVLDVGFMGRETLDLRMLWTVLKDCGESLIKTVSEGGVKERLSLPSSGDISVEESRFCGSGRVVALVESVPTLLPLSSEMKEDWAGPSREDAREGPSRDEARFSDSSNFSSMSDE